MRVQLKESIRMTNLILSRRGLLAGLSSLLAAPAVVRAEALMPIKVWRPPLRWRDGYIVLNGAELTISEFPDLFDAFGHHFGGQGTTFRLPTSGGPPGHEVLTSVDAAWHGLFYPAVVGPFARTQ
jgi:Phage Tail Collar Domain